MLQDPLALIGDDSSDGENEEEEGPGSAKRARVEQSEETQTGVSFAELQHAGYQPVELLETERYLRDVAGQEERKPCQDSSAPPADSAVTEEVAAPPVEVEQRELPSPPEVKLRQDPKSEAIIPSALETFADARTPWEAHRAFVGDGF